MWNQLVRYWEHVYNCKDCEHQECSIASELYPKEGLDDF